ncbi:MAG: LysM peptidoglycan-binding domain-containing protein [Salinispira sp.]
MHGCRRLSRAALLLVVGFFILPPTIIFSLDIEYRVQAGETFYSISRKYNITHQQLMSANNIHDEQSLRVGQILRIPQAGSAFLEKYEIQGGDTLYSISRRNGMSVQDILDFNNLSPDDIIQPGQVLQLNPQSERSFERQTDRSFGQQREGSGTVPVTLSSQTVSPTITAPAPQLPGTLFWPHGGEQIKLSGKFPGIAIRGESGDNIRAVSSGRVVYSGPHSTLGNVVFIQNERGYIYIYGGNRNLLIVSGDSVQAGQIIGTLGPSPLLQEVQVYFSVWKEGRYIDPAKSPR